MSELGSLRQQNKELLASRDHWENVANINSDSCNDAIARAEAAEAERDRLAVENKRLRKAVRRIARHVRIGEREAIAVMIEVRPGSIPYRQEIAAEIRSGKARDLVAMWEVNP